MREGRRSAEESVLLIAPPPIAGLQRRVLDGGYCCLAFAARCARRRNRSTWPPVSTKRCSPVKNGWQREQTSMRICGRVERVSKLLPQPQVIVAVSYFG